MSTTAEGILLAAERYDGAEPVNLGASSGEVGVRDLVSKVCEMTGYRGDVRWDPSRPDGQPRRRVDGERARQLLGFVPRVGLDEGLRRTIDWFEQQRVG